jgi:hypothetical protein
MRARLCLRAPVRSSQAEGKDAIYVGKGKFVKDDARKYPVRERRAVCWLLAKRSSSCAR